jgi:hypothetical protein
MSLRWSGSAAFSFCGLYGRPSRGEYQYQGDQGGRNEAVEQIKEGLELLKASIKSCSWSLVWLDSVDSSVDPDLGGISLHSVRGDEVTLFIEKHPRQVVHKRERLL